MKIVRFLHDAQEHWGVLDGPDIFLVRGDVFGQFTVLDSRVAADLVSLLSPCNPSKGVGIGKNYLGHAQEMHSDLPKEPIIFLKPSTSLLPPGGVVVIPPGVTTLHYEAELAVVIGKTAKNVSRENALDFVLGYTCANDVTARDYQPLNGQWTRAKSFDTFMPLGPCIATGLDPSDLSIRLAVNGQVHQDDTTANLNFKVDQLIEFVSHSMTLLPGDVILTGTPEGVGRLQDGDTVTVEIEGIGTLTNTVTQG
ncbi:fumarylacetoacetate hydrolase family protein [Fundidesulfovibrio butyratiphilus]